MEFPNLKILRQMLLVCSLQVEIMAVVNLQEMQGGVNKSTGVIFD